MYKVACFSLKVLYWPSNLLCWCYDVLETMFSHRLSNECLSEIWAVLVDFSIIIIIALNCANCRKRETFLISEINHSSLLSKKISFDWLTFLVKLKSMFLFKRDKMIDLTMIDSWLSPHLRENKWSVKYWLMHIPFVHSKQFPSKATSIFQTQSCKINSLLNRFFLSLSAHVSCPCTISQWNQSRVIQLYPALFKGFVTVFGKVIARISHLD